MSRCLKKYPTYRSTLINMLGDIPTHWRLSRLKFVSRLGYGSALVSEPDVDGMVPVFGSNGQFSSHSTSNTCAPVIIVGRKGSFGKITFSARPVFAVDTTYIIDKRFTSHDLRWLYYSLQVLRLDAISRDTGVPGLSRESTYSQVLPIPTSIEQRAIAAFLDHETARIDRLIEKQQRLIVLLQEKRQAVISHAVTKGVDPDVPMKNSGVEWLGKVPAHWVICPLRWYATVQGGLAKGKSYEGAETVERPYLRVANVQDGYVDLSDVHTVLLSVSDVAHYSLQPGDVLMNEGGDNDKLGRGTVWNGEVEGCLHQNHVFAIRPNKRLIPEWLAMFTRSGSARAYFYLYSKQSTNLASISSSNVMSCPLPIPPVVEQRKIVECVSDRVNDINKLVGAAEDLMSLLAEHRTALISAAVTGQIDVRDWQPPEAEDVEATASSRTETV